MKVGWPGLEPGTNALKGRCSTIELPTHLSLFDPIRLAGNQPRKLSGLLYH